MGMKNKKTIYRIHFNKQKQCWSVHNRKICYLVDHIIFNNIGHLETQEKPNNKSNPRYFLICYGLEHFFGYGTEESTMFIDG